MAKKTKKSKITKKGAKEVKNPMHRSAIPNFIPIRAPISSMSYCQDPRGGNKGLSAIQDIGQTRSESVTGNLVIT